MPNSFWTNEVRRSEQQRRVGRPTFLRFNGLFCLPVTRKTCIISRFLSFVSRLRAFVLQDGVSQTVGPPSQFSVGPEKLF